MKRTTLLQRPLISVSDFRCSAGPDDKPFVEQYRCHSISYVRKGSFGCRTRGRSFELVSGSILVGFPGDEYVCTHDHVCGDECLSFFLSPDLIETIGGPMKVWRIGAAPPLPELMVFGELAQAAAFTRSEIALDERYRGGRANRSRSRLVTGAARWKPRCGSRPIRNTKSISTRRRGKPASARSISCACLPACSASPRINIWCGRGCAMRRAC
jgi:hypothetical protein